MSAIAADQVKPYSPAKFWSVRFASIVVVLALMLILQYLLLPLLDSYDVRLIVLALLYGTLAVSLNIINGITGQFSIGHAAFYMVGAYTAGKVTQPWAMAHVFPCPQWMWLVFMVILGGAAAGFAGFIVGLPSLRLKGDYLAIVTLGFGEIARIIVQNQDGGPQAIGHLDLGGAYTLFVHIKMTEVAYVALLFIFAVAVARNVLKTAHGLSFLSVREDELAASAVGVNTTRTKVTAFVLGAALAGMAGALFALFNNTVSPDDFKMDVSFLVVAMVVIGGTGSITGAALAAIGLKLFEEALRNFNSVPAISLFAYVIAIVLFIVVSKYTVKLFLKKAVEQVLRYIGYLGCAGLLYLGWLNLHASISPVIKTAFIALMLVTFVAFVFTPARASLPKFGSFLVFAVLIYLIQVPIAAGLHHIPVIEASYNDKLNPVTYTPSDLRWAVYALSLVIIMILRPQGIMGHHELSWSAIGKLFGKRGPRTEVAA